MYRINTIALLLSIIVFGCLNAPKTEHIKTEESTLQDGDIIFQISRSSQSDAIRLATGSKYSHMGIIYIKGGECFVYEAVEPVKVTPLRAWISRGEGGHYVVKRLKNSDKILSAKTLDKMLVVAEKFKGKNYDLYFEWSDDRMYCSELVWKIYEEGANIEIGQLERLADFDLSNDIVKKKLKERYGDKVPLNQKVISPSAMFNSEMLMTIKQE